MTTFFRSATEMWKYYKEVLLKAFKDTLHFFGWNYRTFFVFLIVFFLGLLFHYYRSGLKPVLSEVENVLDFVVYPLILLGSALFVGNLINAPVTLAKESKIEIETLKNQLEPFINPQELSLDDIRDALTGSVKDAFESRMMIHEKEGMSEAEASEVAMKWIETTYNGSRQIREIQRKFKRGER